MKVANCSVIMESEKMISVVMPIHNEQEYLPYSLNALVKAPIDELIIVLDRCTDRSKQILENVKFPYKTVIIEKTWKNWRFPIAENFELGFSKARGDYLYTMAGDFVLDYKGQFNLNYFKNADILAYFYWNFDLHKYKLRQWYSNFLKKYLAGKTSNIPLKRTSGHIGFKREVWEKLHFRDVASEDGEFLRRALDNGFKFKYVPNLNNYHLRVDYSKEEQMFRGFLFAHRRVHRIRILLHSFINFCPYVWVAYQRETQSNWIKHFLVSSSFKMRNQIAKSLVPNIYKRGTQPTLRPTMVYANKTLGNKLVGVEIGVQDGLNALSILATMPIKMLYLIDPYQSWRGLHLAPTQREQDIHLENAKRNLASFQSQIKFILKKSENAVNDLPSDLDFVYVDGDHSYLNVKQDIELYYAKLRHGGVIGGHDYVSDYFGVKRAVDEFAEQHKIAVNNEERDWFFVKN